jgi:integrase
MWQAVRSRLSDTRAYEDATNQSLVAGLRDESRRPDEIQAAFETFSALVEDLGTPGSRRKYLSDVRGWYRWLVNIGEANYSPIVRFETRLNLDQLEYDNPSLSRDDVRVLVDAADTNREQLVVVALAG